MNEGGCPRKTLPGLEVGGTQARESVDLQLDFHNRTLTLSSPKLALKCMNIDLMAM